ncbi:hypothetical protein E2320_002464 [Naja naja]|nr:hypothetical protein E2320_002464 [Naja naja]
MGYPENLLKKLYKSSNVLQVAPKAKITKNEEIRKLEVQKDLTIEIAKISENKEKTHELEIQKEVATEISEHSGEFTMRSKSPLKWLKKHQKTIQEDHELGKKQTGEELFCSFLKKRRQFVKSIQKLQGEQVKMISYTVMQQWWKPPGQQAIQKVKKWPPVTSKAKITGKKKKSHELEIQKDVATEISEALKVKRWPKHQFTPQASVHSLQKCSILHLPTQLPALTSSIVVDDGGVEQPDKVVFILKSGNRSARPSHVVISEQAKEKNTQNEQITDKLSEEEPEKEQESRKENLRHLIIGGSNSRISTQESETFNELLPDKTLSKKAHWEYQEQTTSAPLLSDFWSSNDNYFLQGDAFEAEVQKQLAHLIPNEPMRNLIAHLIHMIKMDCRELTIQKPCDFFHR